MNLFVKTICILFILCNIVYPGNVILTWTATGDDGYEGTATEYDIRWSFSELTEDNWNEANEIYGEPTPDTAGSPESMLIPNVPCGTYYFGIKARDEAWNWSSLGSGSTAYIYVPGIMPPAGLIWTQEVILRIGGPAIKDTIKQIGTDEVKQIKIPPEEEDERDKDSGIGRQ